MPLLFMSLVLQLIPLFWSAFNALKTIVFFFFTLMSLKQTKITIYIFVLKNLFRVLRTKWSFNESKEVHEENMPTLHTKFIKILSVLREYFHPFVVYLKKILAKCTLLIYVQLICKRSVAYLEHCMRGIPYNRGTLCALFCQK